jgi:putative membrane protein
MTAALLPLADHWGHDGPGWGFAFVPLIWIAVIVGIVLLIRATGGFGRRGWSRRETAVEALERRFAEGQIDADELRERRAVLDERTS